MAEPKYDKLKKIFGDFSKIRNLYPYIISRNLFCKFDPQYPNTKYYNSKTIKTNCVANKLYYMNCTKKFKFKLKNDPNLLQKKTLILHHDVYA